MLPKTLNLTTGQMTSLGIFCFLITIFGMIGNFTVIYASFRYNALKLDKGSLIFIHNLAVADLLYTVITVFPNFVTYSAGVWVLGGGWCFVQAQLRFAPAMANCLLILAITVHRVVLFTVPLRALSNRNATICSVVIWAVAILDTSLTLGLTRSTEKLDDNIGACVSSLMDDHRMVVLVNTIVLILLPLVLITLTNFVICGIAIKHSSGSDDIRKGITLTCLLSGLFIVSWSPYIVRGIYSLVDGGDVPQEISLLAYNCVAINSFVNPILYSVTNRRFRKYVFGIVSYIWQLITWQTPRNRLEVISMRNI